MDRKNAWWKVSAAGAQRVQGQEGCAGRARSHSSHRRARTPESIARYLSDEQLKLYTLIWRRFVASQMTPAVFRRDHGEDCGGEAKDGKTYDFRVSGSVLRFDGFLKVYEVSEEKKGRRR
jgi:DNA topoisomerase IA